LGKKNKKTKNQNDFVKTFAWFNALDLKVMIEEQKKPWDANEHTAIENYLHYRAETMGR